MSCRENQPFSFVMEQRIIKFIYNLFIFHQLKEIIIILATTLNFMVQHQTSTSLLFFTQPLRHKKLPKSNAYHPIFFITLFSSGTTKTTLYLVFDTRFPDYHRINSVTKIPDRLFFVLPWNPQEMDIQNINICLILECMENDAYCSPCEGQCRRLISTPDYKDLGEY